MIEELSRATRTAEACAAFFAHVEVMARFVRKESEELAEERMNWCAHRFDEEERLRSAAYDGKLQLLVALLEGASGSHRVDPTASSYTNYAHLRRFAGQPHHLGHDRAPLEQASEQGHLRCVEALLRAGASLDLPTLRAAISGAARLGAVEILGVLLAEAPGADSLTTAVMAAAASAQSGDRALQWLLSSRHVPLRDAARALRVAIDRGTLSSVEALLQSVGRPSQPASTRASTGELALHDVERRHGRQGAAWGEARPVRDAVRAHVRAWEAEAQVEERLHEAQERPHGGDAEPDDAADEGALLQPRRGGRRRGVPAQALAAEPEEDGDEDPLEPTEELVRDAPP